MIAIAGMHRSGTSAFAGALHKLGADLGPASSWLPPADDNPRGFYEYAPVVDLNREILAALGGTWSSPPPLPAGWIDDERISELRKHAEELSTEIPERMVVKDPRLSLLRPLWDRAGKVLATVICVRHPMAVANSLLARNDLTVDQGLFLWFRYNTAAKLNDSEGLVVHYESLLEDPVSQLGHIADYLNLEVSEKTLQAATTTVYRGMAHHERAQLPETPIGEICRRLYDVLRSGEALESDQDLWIWGRIATELPWAGPDDRAISRARRQVAESRSEVGRLVIENQVLERRIQRLSSELRHALRTTDIQVIAENADMLESQEGDLR